MNQNELKDLVNQGKSIREISKVLGKSYASVRYWLKRLVCVLVKN
jgi:transposase